MELALYLVAGFIAGAWLARRIYHYILLARAQAVVKNLGQLADVMVLGTVEQVGDMYFVYNQITEEFLAQGRTWEEIRTHFKTRFPGKVCAIDEAWANVIPRLTTAESES